MYGPLAKYYDRIYHWKDYRKEAEKVKRLVRSRARIRCRTLLDVGCGTGIHIRYLRRNFECVGIDSSREMLAAARREVPGTRFKQGDMVDFDLGRRFDVVTCLFSAIGYLETRKRIRKAIDNFAKHTNTGGVLIIEPWIMKSKWRDKTIDVKMYESPELKIVRVDYGRARGAFSFVDERYLIAERNKGVSYLKTSHVMRFFEKRAMLIMMRQSGFEAEYLAESLTGKRGLLVGVKTGAFE